LATFIRRVKQIRDAAGLPKEITFPSFRHGGFTAGDADLSDADVNAVGAKTEATLDIYRKGAMEQRRRALARLLDQRMRGASEWSQARNNVGTIRNEAVELGDWWLAARSSIKPLISSAGAYLHRPSPTFVSEMNR
jgi:hypothetical protein